MTELKEDTSPAQARPRAVFSTQDFRLLKKAVGVYLEQIKDDPDSIKFANLYHRLGRLG